MHDGQNGAMQAVAASQVAMPCRAGLQVRETFIPSLRQHRGSPAPLKTGYRRVMGSSPTWERSWLSCCSPSNTSAELNLAVLEMMRRMTLSMRASLLTSARPPGLAGAAPGRSRKVLMPASNDILKHASRWAKPSGGPAHPLHSAATAWADKDEQARMRCTSRQPRRLPTCVAFCHEGCAVQHDRRLGKGRKVKVRNRLAALRL